MAVDYSGAKAVGSAKQVEVKPLVPLVSGYIDMEDKSAQKPSINDIFLSLLTSHTMSQGGIKYWRPEKNIPGNVQMLKQMAQKIQEAF